MIRVQLRKMNISFGNPGAGHVGALHKLTLHEDLRPRTKFKLVTVLDTVVKRYQKYDEDRDKLVHKHALRNAKTDETERDAHGNAMFENRAAREAFEEELEAMLDEIVEIPGEKLTARDLRSMDTKTSIAADKTLIDKLNAQEIMALLWLLDDTRFNDFDKKDDEKEEEPADSPKK